MNTYVISNGSALTALLLLVIVQYFSCFLLEAFVFFEADPYDKQEHDDEDDYDEDEAKVANKKVNGNTFQPFCGSYCIFT